MEQTDNRKYPRIPQFFSKSILHLDESQVAKENVILIENISANGIKFTSNQNLPNHQIFLLSLDEQVEAELQKLYPDHAWVSSGENILAKIVWTDEIQKDQGVYSYGATFVDKKDCHIEDLETFTHLVNQQMFLRL